MFFDWLFKKKEEKKCCIDCRWYLDKDMEWHCINHIVAYDIMDMLKKMSNRYNPYQHYCENWKKKEEGILND